jgi:hypothetical protein
MVGVSAGESSVLVRHIHMAALTPTYSPQAGLKEATTGSRKMRRELKNRKNKVRGKKKGLVGK